MSSETQRLPMSSETQNMLKENPRLEKWKNNDRIVTALYRAQHPKNDLEGLKEKDEVTNAELLVASVWGSSSMVCCPNCGTKIDADAGVRTKCDSRSCKGAEVLSTRKEIQRLLAGDIKGFTTVLNFFPSTYELDEATAKSLVGKVLLVTGKVGRIQEGRDGSKTPNIAVRSLKVVEDVFAEGTPLSAFSNPTAVITEPTPLAPTISQEKTVQIRGYMYAMNNSVNPEQLKQYVENNAKLKWEEVSSLFEPTGPSNEFLKLKGFDSKALKEEIKKSVK